MSWPGTEAREGGDRYGGENQHSSIKNTQLIYIFEMLWIRVTMDEQSSRTGMQYKKCIHRFCIQELRHVIKIEEVH